MDHKHSNTCAPSQQIKTTKRHHFVATKLAKIKKQEHSRRGCGVTGARVHDWWNHPETPLGLPSRGRTPQSGHALLGLRSSCTSGVRGVCRKLRAALFIMAERQKQAQVHRWAHTQWMPFGSLGGGYGPPSAICEPPVNTERGRPAHTPLWRPERAEAQQQSVQE